MARFFVVLMVLLAASSVAVADSLSIGFEPGEGYSISPGRAVNGTAEGKSINGQNGWFVEYSGNSVDEEIAAVGAGGSSQSWRISNWYSNGIVIHAASPALAQPAGEPGRAAKNVFRADFMWKSASATGDNSVVQISPDDGTGSRWGGRLDITNFSAPATFDGRTVSAGVQLDWDTIVNDTDSYITSPVLNRDTWYRTIIRITFVPGTAGPTPNDTVTIQTYEVATGNLVWNVGASAGASTWELAGYGGTGAVNRLVWRTRWNTSQATGNSDYSTDRPAGFYFDNLTIGTSSSPIYVDGVSGRDTTGDGSQAHPYATIQKGVSVAAAGDTVQVAAGTYVEQVEITKDITVTGAGAGTVIQSPATLALSYTTSAPNKPVVYVHDTSNAVLQNLTVDGAGQGNANYRFQGIAYRNAGGQVQSVTVTRVRETPFNGDQHGIAIYAYNTDGTSRTLTVNNCTVTDYQKGGIVLNGDHFTVTVTGNTITGNGPTPLNAQNGIQIGYGASGTVTGNNFSTNNSWTGSYGGDNDPATGPNADGAAGILLYGSGAVTVSNNTLVGNQFGIWAVGAASVNISGNTILGSTTPATTGTGIAIWDADQWGATPVATTGSIQDNTISSNQYGVLLRSFSLALGVGLSGNNITGNTVGVYNASSAVVSATGNWWGEPSGAMPIGLGDSVSGAVTVSSPLAKPASPNALYLQPTDASIYIKPSETAVIDLNVANLQQQVTALQAMINFSSTYFKGNISGAGAPSIVAGGGAWDQLIYDVWTTGGNLDVAVGVQLTKDNPGAGTQADATTAIITLTPTGTEGVTQLVFRPDVNPDPGLTQSTFLADTAGNPVWPSKVNSTNIVIDGTPPTSVTISANPASWTNSNSVTMTFSATDALSGIDYYQLQVDSGGSFYTATSPATIDVTHLTDGTHTVTVKAFDKAGNSATASTTISLDKTAPTLSITSAKQAGNELIGTSVNALQGVVDIYISADGSVSGLAANPAVTVTPNGGSAQAAAFADVAAGVYHYTWSVSSGTPNGTATINASVTDNAGNSQTATAKQFNVNKNQITGSVSFSTLVSTVYTVNRNVVFVATDIGNNVVKTWNPVNVAFANNTSTQIASGSYTLTDVPAGTAHVSAKTAWTLRKKQTATLGADGQLALDFVLLGGDLDNSNSVNILDYSWLKVNYYTHNAAYDINGDGQVDLVDYSIMKVDWFLNGDAQ